MTIHLGRPLPDASRDLPEERCENAPVVQSHRSFLFGLAPGGVYRAAPVSRRAVRSYRTLSPLPVGFATNWRFAFCGTFPGVAPAGRYPAPCFRGARTFLPLQVSHSKARSSSRLTPKALYRRNGGLRKQLGHESYICGRGVRVALRP